MKNFKNKTILAIVLDLISLGVIGYIATQTTNLLLMFVLALLIFAFAYDCTKAIVFLIKLLIK